MGVARKALVITEPAPLHPLGASMRQGGKGAGASAPTSLADSMQQGGKRGKTVKTGKLGASMKQG